MSALADLLARTERHCILAHGMPFTFYAPQTNVLPDLNMVPNGYAPAGGAVGALQMNDKAAGRALQLGFFNVLAGFIGFPAEVAGQVGDRYALIDAQNRAWIVRGVPEPDELDTPVLVTCFVTQLTVRPDGLPE